MKPIRQLWRQPLKMMAGILLITMAVAVLCICLAQTMAAGQTAQRLNKSFVTLALPSSLQSEGSQDWIQKVVTENPDIFLGEFQQGLASAYVPGLHLDNETNHLTITQNMTDNFLFLPDFRSYSGAMLELTITGYVADVITGADGDSEPGYTLYGVVDRVLGLEPGYHDPTGFRVVIHSIEDLFPGQNVSYGQRCLVYSQQYEDLDWTLRSSMIEAGKIFFWGEDVEIPDWQMRSFSVEVNQSGGSHWNTHKNTEYFRLKHGTYRVQKMKCQLGDLITYVDPERFHTIRLTLEDADSTYPLPRIALLGTQTAEQFLVSEPDWQQTLNNIRINYKTFPVIGVTDLAYVSDFSRNVTRVTAGRKFTQEELASGAKVCLISKQAAEKSGLEVGDTLDIRFYNYDYNNPHQQYIHNGDGAMAPSAYRYAEGITPWAGEMTEYTIVGLYEQNYEWYYSDDNFYGFTTNTIFVPKGGVPSDMDTAIAGMFTSWILNNERLMDLQQMTLDAGFDGAFTYYDNGYNVLAQSLASYEQAAKLMLPLGAAIYGMIMILFLCMFPLRQGRTVAMQDSLGTGFLRKLGFVLDSTLGILLPGSMMGAVVSIYAWEYLAKALMDFVGTNVDLTLSQESLWIAAAVQLLAVLGFTALLAIPMVLRANLMKNK